MPSTVRARLMFVITFETCERQEIEMDNKLIRRLLVGAFLISLVSSPAAFAIGAWATLADAIWDFEQDQLENFLGESVSATGDFNNDGYSDVAVGSRFFNSGQVRSGRVWVFYGSEDGPATTPSLTINPPVINAHGYFGEAVAAADVDGDNHDDLLIGMPNYDSSTSDDGAVFLYYGSNGGLDANWDWRVTGTALYAHTGLEVASAGDLDNDGYDDILIGARRYDACNGAAPIINHGYLFYGSNARVGTTTVASADWYAMGDQCIPWDDAGFGTVLGSAGDLNGDGYGDILIGAPFYDAGQANEGKVFVWYGSATGFGAPGNPSNADWTAEGDQADARMGTSAMNAVASGDFDADGYDDLIVGIRLYDHMETNDGMALVWYGSADGLGDVDGDPINNDWLAYGAAENDQFGGNVRVLNYNGDSYDDVLIGAIGHTVGAVNYAGMTLLWLGTEDGLGAEGPLDYADWAVEGDQASSYFGWSLSTGDTDGDGYDDMVIAAPYYDLTTNDAGKVWTFLGEPTIFIENFETGDTDRCSTTIE